MRNNDCATCIGYVNNVAMVLAIAPITNALIGAIARPCCFEQFPSFQDCSSSYTKNCMTGFETNNNEAMVPDHKCCTVLSCCRIVCIISEIRLRYFASPVVIRKLVTHRGLVINTLHIPAKQEANKDRYRDLAVRTATLVAGDDDCRCCKRFLNHSFV